MKKELQKAALRKAIREKCLDCCCDQEKEVRICEIRKCSLWPYRLNVREYQDPVDGKIYTAVSNEEVIEETI